MKTFNELSKQGKSRRLNKALDILSINVNSGTVLDRSYDILFDYQDTKSENCLNDLRNELLYVNKYRGYFNICPLEEIEKLLF